MNAGEIAHWKKWRTQIENPCGYLDALELKTVVRESHKEPILSLRYNETSEAYGNLLASVGGNQVTVYDDTHLGQYINVVLQFTNVATTQTAGGVISMSPYI